MVSTVAMAVVALHLLGCIGGARTFRPIAPLASRDALVGEYRAFLDQARTPARALTWFNARFAGFISIDPLSAAVSKPIPGDRLVITNHARSAIYVIVGKRPVSEGIRMVASHLDTPSPRVLTREISRDNADEISARGYGGMRFSHWLHRRLALVGRVATAAGEIEISLGETDGYHLIADSVSGDGRSLSVTMSSRPTDAKAATTWIDVLFARHGITADDLGGAELYLVPADRARIAGLDASLIAAHGQDDRSNSFVSLHALADLQTVPEYTAMVWLVDREEIGSNTRNGAQSQFLELTIAALLRAQGVAATTSNVLRTLGRSQVLSSDTPAAINPNFPEVHEAKNAPVLGAGPALFPFTGHGGKVGGGQAHPELVRSVLDAFAAAGQPVQGGELGRVDEGGGGTIAKYLAERGMDVVDIGVAVVGMHSPMEVTSIEDLFAAYKGFGAWLGR